MPVNRLHAFAEGVTFPAPERLSHLPQDHPDVARAQTLWSRFREVATISDVALLGVDAWPINLTDDRLRLTIGANTVVRGVLRVERKGHIRIGDYCYVGDDVIISAHTGVEIEPEVLVAHGVQIFDNVSHPIDAMERARHYRAILSGQAYEVPISSSPIVIERNAWIGMNSIIMRGVRVGARSIVAAGSVVVGDVPPDTTILGNPARPISQRTT